MQFVASAPPAPPPCFTNPTAARLAVLFFVAGVRNFLREYIVVELHNAAVFVSSLHLFKPPAARCRSRCLPTPSAALNPNP